MTKLILAQGAAHIETGRLYKIVEQINFDNGRLDAHSFEEIMLMNKVTDMIQDKYESDLRNIAKVHAIIIPHLFENYIVEEKFDGYSYLNCEGKFFSKRLSAAKGNEGQPVEKTGHLPHISKIMKHVYEMTGCDVHGEIYVPNGISDDMTKILGCTEDEAVRRIQSDYDRRPRYMLIDIRSYKGQSLLKEPYYVRRALLEFLYYTYIRPIDPEENIQIAPILTDDPREEFRRIVNSGGEGIIIKRTNALYCPDKKPVDNWIKGKKKVTVDVVIMGFNDGTGKNKKLFGSIEFGLYIDGKLAKRGNASSGLSDEVRAKIANNPESYIGTVMEIEAIQPSVNSFRNARFIRLRDDKDATECTPLGIKAIDDLLK